MALLRGRGPAGEVGQLEQYVNDRPYAANSFLSVAMRRVFLTAMSGRSKDRPELAGLAEIGAAARQVRSERAKDFEEGPLPIVEQIRRGWPQRAIAASCKHLAEAMGGQRFKCNVYCASGFEGR